MTLYYKLQRGAKWVAPTFKFWEETTQKVSWTLKGVFLNNAKEVEKKDWTGKVTIPANLNLIFEEDFSVQIIYEMGGLFRNIANSILSANLGDKVEMYAFIKNYVDKNWENRQAKAVNITNPDDRVTRKTKDWEEFTANNFYPWAFDIKKDVPEVEIIKNKKGEFVSADDSEANEFFISKLTEKFVTPNKKTSDELTVADLPF